jgi:hypothetical protein
VEPTVLVDLVAVDTAEPAAEMEAAIREAAAEAETIMVLAAMVVLVLSSSDIVIRHKV